MQWMRQVNVVDASGKCSGLHHFDYIYKRRNIRIRKCVYAHARIIFDLAFWLNSTAPARIAQNRVYGVLSSNRYPSTKNTSVSPQRASYDHIGLYFYPVLLATVKTDKTATLCKHDKTPLNWRCLLCQVGQHQQGQLSGNLSAYLKRYAMQFSPPKSICRITHLRR